MDHQVTKLQKNTTNGNEQMKPPVKFTLGMHQPNHSSDVDNETNDEYYNDGYDSGSNNENDVTLNEKTLVKNNSSMSSSNDHLNYSNNTIKHQQASLLQQQQNHPHHHHQSQEYLYFNNSSDVNVNRLNLINSYSHSLPQLALNNLYNGNQNMLQQPPPPQPPPPPPSSQSSATLNLPPSQASMQQNPSHNFIYSAAAAAAAAAAVAMMQQQPPLLLQPPQMSASNSTNHSNFNMINQHQNHHKNFMTHFNPSDSLSSISSINPNNTNYYLKKNDNPNQKEQNNLVNVQTQPPLPPFPQLPPNIGIFNDLKLNPFHFHSLDTFGSFIRYSLKLNNDLVNELVNNPKIQYWIDRNKCNGFVYQAYPKIDESKRQIPQVRCELCKFYGHLSHTCSIKDLAFKLYNSVLKCGACRCHICGQLGHPAETGLCPYIACSFCRQFGHWNHACPNIETVSKTLCHNCQRYGHKTERCPDMWRQFDRISTFEQTAPKTSAELNKKPIYCYQCAKKGHYGHDCPDFHRKYFIRDNHQMTPVYFFAGSSPFVRLPSIINETDKKLIEHLVENPLDDFFNTNQVDEDPLEMLERYQQQKQPHDAKQQLPQPQQQYVPSATTTTGGEMIDLRKYVRKWINWVIDYHWTFTLKFLVDNMNSTKLYLFIKNYPILDNFILHWMWWSYTLNKDVEMFTKDPFRAIGTMPWLVQDVYKHNEELKMDLSHNTSETSINAKSSSLKNKKADNQLPTLSSNLNNNSKSIQINELNQTQSDIQLKNNQNVNIPNHQTENKNIEVNALIQAEQRSGIEVQRESCSKQIISSPIEENETVNGANPQIIINSIPKQPRKFDEYNEETSKSIDSMTLKPADKQMNYKSAPLIGVQAAEKLNNGKKPVFRSSSYTTSSNQDDSNQCLFLEQQQNSIIMNQFKNSSPNKDQVKNENLIHHQQQTKLEDWANNQAHILSFKETCEYLKSQMNLMNIKMANFNNHLSAALNTAAVSNQPISDTIKIRSKSDSAYNCNGLLNYYINEVNNEDNDDLFLNDDVKSKIVASNNDLLIASEINDIVLANDEQQDEIANINGFKEEELENTIVFFDPTSTNSNGLINEKKLQDELLIKKLDDYCNQKDDEISFNIKLEEMKPVVVEEKLKEEKKNDEIKTECLEMKPLNEEAPNEQEQSVFEKFIKSFKNEDLNAVKIDKSNERDTIQQNHISSSIKLNDLLMLNEKNDINGKGGDKDDSVIQKIINKKNDSMEKLANFINTSTSVSAASALAIQEQQEQQMNEKILSNVNPKTASKQQQLDNSANLIKLLLKIDNKQKQTTSSTSSVNPTVSVNPPTPAPAILIDVTNHTNDLMSILKCSTSVQDPNNINKGSTSATTNVLNKIMPINIDTNLHHNQQQTHGSTATTTYLTCQPLSSSSSSSIFSSSSLFSSSSSSSSISRLSISPSTSSFSSNFSSNLSPTNSLNNQSNQVPSNISLSTTNSSTAKPAIDSSNSSLNSCDSLSTSLKSVMLLSTSTSSNNNQLKDVESSTEKQKTSTSSLSSLLLNTSSSSLSKGTSVKSKETSDEPTEKSYITTSTSSLLSSSSSQLIDSTTTSSSSASNAVNSSNKANLNAKINASQQSSINTSNNSQFNSNYHSNNRYYNNNYNSKNSYYFNNNRQQTGNFYYNKSNVSKFSNYHHNNHYNHHNSHHHYQNYQQKSSYLKFNNDNKRESVSSNSSSVSSSHLPSSLNNGQHNKSSQSYSCNSNNSSLNYKTSSLNMSNKSENKSRKSSIGNHKMHSKNSNEKLGYQQYQQLQEQYQNANKQRETKLIEAITSEISSSSSSSITPPPPSSSKASSVLSHQKYYNNNTNQHQRSVLYSNSSTNQNSHKANNNSAFGLTKSNESANLSVLSSIFSSNNNNYNNNFKPNYHHKSKNLNAEVNTSNKKSGLNDSLNLNKQHVEHADQSLENESCNRQQVNNPVEQFKSKLSGSGQSSPSKSNINSKATSFNSNYNKGGYSQQNNKFRLHSKNFSQHSHFNANSNRFERNKQFFNNSNNTNGPTSSGFINSTNGQNVSSFYNEHYTNQRQANTTSSSPKTYFFKSNNSNAVDGGGNSGNEPVSFQYSHQSDTMTQQVTSYFTSRHKKSREMLDSQMTISMSNQQQQHQQTPAMLSSSSIYGSGNGSGSGSKNKKFYKKLMM